MFYWVQSTFENFYQPQNFDESSPLSVPDLRLLINRLQIRSLHIKQIRDYIISHQHDFSDIFSQCSEISSKSESISIDISNILSLISDHEIRERASEITRTSRELKEKKEMLGLVQIIVNLVEILKVVKEELKNGRVIQAAESLRDLKKALLISDGIDEDRVVEEGEPVVFGLLREEFNECFDEVQEFFVRVMEDAVKFESGNGGCRVRVKFRVSIDGIEKLEE